jgi:hypothetical protein
MRIISFRVMPVARIFAIIYGAIGVFYVGQVLIAGLGQVTLPVGILVPLIHLNFNLHLPAPTHFLTGILSALAAFVCYAASGWLTGAAAVLAFNFVARRMGGIDASILTNDNIAVTVGSAARAV